MVWNSLSRRKKTGNYGRQMTIKQDNDTVGSYSLLKKVTIHFETAHTSEARAREHWNKLVVWRRRWRMWCFHLRGDERKVVTWVLKHEHGGGLCSFLSASTLFCRCETLRFCFHLKITCVEQKTPLSRVCTPSVSNLCSIHQATVKAFRCQMQAYWLMTAYIFLYVQSLLFVLVFYAWETGTKAAFKEGLQSVDVWEASTQRYFTLSCKYGNNPMSINYFSSWVTYIDQS